MLPTRFIPYAIVAGLLLATVLVALLALRTVERMEDTARETAIQERDAYWKGEIERSNAAAERRLVEQAKAVVAIEANANARVRAAESKLTQLETDNAALPNGDACGLSRDRVRLLNR